MLLKISLGLAILVGLVTLYVTNFQVGGKITELKGNLEQTTQQLTSEQESNRKLTADNRTLKNNLETTVKNLNEATNHLAQALARAEEQTIRANTASTNLLRTTEERNEAQRELAQWRAFELSPEQIRNNLSRLRNVERERDTYVADNQALNRERDRLKRELRRYTGEVEEIPELPAGTKGTVVAVDPKYDFVVLDIGGNQQIVENARLLVNRDGKLIGKVKITAVEPNRSVANILPEWKQDEIMEGDQVIY